MNTTGPGDGRGQHHHLHLHPECSDCSHWTSHLMEWTNGNSLVRCSHGDVSLPSDWLSCWLCCWFCPSRARSADGCLAAVPARLLYPPETTGIFRVLSTCEHMLWIIYLKTGICRRLSTCEHMLWSIYLKQLYVEDYQPVNTCHGLFT